MNIDEIFELYRSKFVLAYTDYLSLTTSKPEQILIEESNILSHLSQYFNSGISCQSRENNLLKAHNHLIRATLDLHKLTWADLRQKLDGLIISDSKSRLCFNSPEHEVLKEYAQFIELAKDARNYEMQNIGDRPEDTIEHYEKVNQIGFQLLQKFDTVKHSRITSFTNIIRTREFFWGVAASLVAAGIIALL
ncbi:MAG TPA: hypothetical protein ENK33_02185 [Desulfobacterales bacterium]|nr:hypothetical protein [Desulfobacterales bacterium]